MLPLTCRWHRPPRPASPFAGTPPLSQWRSTGSPTEAHVCTCALSLGSNSFLLSSTIFVTLHSALLRSPSRWWGSSRVQHPRHSDHRHRHRSQPRYWLHHHGVCCYRKRGQPRFQHPHLHHAQDWYSNVENMYSWSEKCWMVKQNLNPIMCPSVFQIPSPPLTWNWLMWVTTPSQCAGLLLRDQSEATESPASPKMAWGHPTLRW